MEDITDLSLLWAPLGQFETEGELEKPDVDFGGFEENEKITTLILFGQLKKEEELQSEKVARWALSPLFERFRGEFKAVMYQPLSKNSLGTFLQEKTRRNLVLMCHHDGKGNFWSGNVKLSVKDILDAKPVNLNFFILGCSSNDTEMLLPIQSHVRLQSLLLPQAEFCIRIRSFGGKDATAQMRDDENKIIKIDCPERITPLHLHILFTMWEESKFGKFTGSEPFNFWNNAEVALITQETIQKIDPKDLPDLADTVLGFPTLVGKWKDWGKSGDLKAELDITKLDIVMKQKLTTSTVFQYDKGVFISCSGCSQIVKQSSFNNTIHGEIRHIWQHLWEEGEKHKREKRKREKRKREKRKREKRKQSGKLLKPPEIFFQTKEPCDACTRAYLRWAKEEEADFYVSWMNNYNCFWPNQIIGAVYRFKSDKPLQIVMLQGERKMFWAEDADRDTMRNLLTEFNTAVTKQAGDDSKLWTDHHLLDQK